MLHTAFGTLALFFGIIGTLCILKAFFSNQEHGRQRKVIFLGWLGLILLFGMGLILIYFYSVQPVSERIINDYQNNSKDSLPDISLQEIFYDGLKKRGKNLA